MSQIPFVQALGDSLDAVAVGRSARAPLAGPGRRPRRPDRPTRRVSLIAVGLALAVAGCAAAAGLLISPSQRLATGYVNCVYGRLTLEGHAVSEGDPVGLCRRDYFSYPPRFRSSGVRFLPCRQNPTNVTVVIARNPGTCAEHGYRPLAAAVPAAERGVRALLRDLTTLQRRHDCWSVPALASATQATLTLLHFTGWRPGLRLSRSTGPTTIGGRCGYVGLAAFDSRALGVRDTALDARNQVVRISNGAPWSTVQLLNHTGYELNQASATRCFTPAAARAVTDRSFAATPMRPRFVTTTLQPGTYFEPRSAERLYQRGCARINVMWPGANGRFVDVWLQATSGRPLTKNDPGPSPSDFHP